MKRCVIVPNKIIARAPPGCTVSISLSHSSGIVTALGAFCVKDAEDEEYV